VVEIQIEPQSTQREPMSQAHRLLVIVFAISLSFLAACGGLAGEPRIVATIPQPTPFPEDFSYLANLASGAQIFAENCTRCHGIGGAGDGELVLSGQIQNIPNLTDQQARANESPQDWFNTITNGRVENLMPPWRDALTAEQRWDVAFYAYTLAYTPEQVALGAELVQTAGRLPFWSAIIYGEAYGRGMPQYSDNEAAAVFAEPIVEDAPDYNDEERLALAIYTRLQPLGGNTFVAQRPTIPPPAATEEVIAATPVPAATNTGAPGTITGRVTNGTALGIVPSETIVTLHTISPDFTTETTANAPIAADGSFIFTGVPFMEGANYFVSVPYRERLFASRTVQAQTTTTSFDLPVTIYELTDDTSVINIVGMVTQIDASATGDGLEFLQVFRFRNISDRLFATSVPAGERGFVSLVINLPPGAIVLGFQGEERYVVIQEQDAVVDTLPVLPNDDHLVQLFYFVPYDNGAIIEQPMNYALNGEVRILLGDENLGLTSQQIAPLGPATVGEREFDSFGATLGLPANDVVRYTLRGQIRAAGTQGAITSGDLLPLVLLAGGSVVLLFVIGVTLRQRYVPRRAAAPVDKHKLIDALVRQIAELDEQHDTGQINHDVYQQRRATLKARLAELMDEQ
jgi:mono/diheme cytochrome c family protein